MQKLQRVSLAIVAGLACSAIAQAEPVLENDYSAISTSNIRSLYYNVATGEIIRTDGQSTRDTGSPIWINEMYDQCGFSEWFYYRILDTRPGTERDQIWLDWGEIAPNSVIDCFTMLLVSTVPDPEEDGEDGLTVEVSFLDAVNRGQLGSGLAPYLTWLVDFPGSASGLAAWLITIDFAGTPENWFEIGDVDGIDDSGNGYNSGYGADLDADGNADFAYAYSFLQPAGIAAISGGGMVVPPEGVTPNSLGDEDSRGRFDNHDWAQFIGTYWFGGYDCSGGAGFLWSPWSTQYLGLYGGDVGPQPCNDADFAEPYGTLDFFDVQAFLGLFSAQDQAADLIDDDVWDFFDVQYFLGQFSAGCP